MGEGAKLLPPSSVNRANCLKEGRGKQKTSKNEEPARTSGEKKPVVYQARDFTSSPANDGLVKKRSGRCGHRHMAYADGYIPVCHRTQPASTRFLKKERRYRSLRAEITSQLQPV